MTDESLEQKLIHFIINHSEAQMQWVRDLNAVQWRFEEPKTKTSHLFVEAHIHGIRQSVAYPLVKAVMEGQGVDISPKELSDRAYHAYMG